MSALPDIKTANKVVELILKNASIAVTGIWLADDDGVLNPANIRLVPGSIIPKAVGSSGLTPLQAPGRFDVSNLVLDDLRARIRHTLLVDRLGPVGGPRMTATEVVERSVETARLLGATYGRLQAELTTPLITRAIAILRRRGEIPDLALDGREVDLQYKSPLARSQARQDVRETLMWLEATAQMGAEATAVVDIPAAARWLGERLGVPGQLVRDLELPPALLDQLGAGGRGPRGRTSSRRPSMPSRTLGWSWFDAAAATAGDDAESRALPGLCALLRGPDGRQVIAHLTRSILDRRLPPQASDAELRHLEGQRFAIAEPARHDRARPRLTHRPLRIDDQEPGMSEQQLQTADATRETMLGRLARRAREATVTAPPSMSRPGRARAECRRSSGTPRRAPCGPRRC